MQKFNNFYTDIYSYFVLKKNIDAKRIEKIFALLRVDTTFKTTSNYRMNDINLKLLKYIKRFFSKKIIICDIGISSGQSTLELYNNLNKTQIESIYGFDKQIYLKIYKIKNLIFLYSKKNDLLFIEYNKYCMRYRYFFIFKKLEKIFPYLFSIFNVKYKKSKVLIPNLDKINKFKCFEQDIFDIEKKYFNLFDVVRVSNLLNYSYFPKSKLKTAIFNINKITKENSILLLNRTSNKKKNIASFFIKKRGKFRLLEDVNGGSEIKNLILSC